MIGLPQWPQRINSPANVSSCERRVGTRDGATIEMAQEAGEENFFLFGLTAQQMADSQGWYSPRWHYDHDPETRAALDLIYSGHFSRDGSVIDVLRDTLLTRGDHYMHLADLRSYLTADQKLVELYGNPDDWARTAILNAAAPGKVFEQPDDRPVRCRNLAREVVPRRLPLVMFEAGAGTDVVAIECPPPMKGTRR